MSDADEIQRLRAERDLLFREFMSTRESLDALTVVVAKQNVLSIGLCWHMRISFFL